MKVITTKDRHAEIRTANAERAAKRELIDNHEDDLINDEGWLQQFQDKHERLVAYIKEMAKQHNELEKRVEALEQGRNAGAKS